MVRWIVARTWHRELIGPIDVASGSCLETSCPMGLAPIRDDRRLGPVSALPRQASSTPIGHNIRLLLLFPKCAGKIDNHHPSTSRAKASDIHIQPRDWMSRLKLKSENSRGDSTKS